MEKQKNVRRAQPVRTLGMERSVNGWKKYPGRPFYFVRIGYPTVHRQHGGLRRR